MKTHENSNTTIPNPQSAIHNPSPTDPIVQVTNVERVYGRGSQAVRALAGVSLTVARGSFVALMGRSGSGKTTLLNCIGGLDRPTAGEVKLLGQALNTLTERQLTRLRRREIGFVFQSFALLPTYSAAENVDIMLRLAGVRSRERRARVAACLELVGLTGHAHHRPAELSGGQQQRVAIARAIAPQPPLLLADEPTGELDSATGKQIFALFRRLVDEQGITVVVATHNADVIEFATQVHELRDGRLLR